MFSSVRGKFEGMPRGELPHPNMLIQRMDHSCGRPPIFKNLNIYRKASTCDNFFFFSEHRSFDKSQSQSSPFPIWPHGKNVSLFSTSSISSFPS